MRDFLLYTTSVKGKCEAELFGNNRLYDVAINDYTGSNIVPAQAEYKYSVDERKFRHVKQALSDIVFNYKACAFFDDDIRASMQDINKLFLVGDTLEFNIWQAALTKDSYCSWKHLYLKDKSIVRNTNKMELMMPFFGKVALQKCWDTFDFSYSSWGIEDVWVARCNFDKIIVVDSIPVKHIRPITSNGKIMPNGMTPEQEYRMTFNHFKIKTPHPIF